MNPKKQILKYIQNAYADTNRLLMKGHGCGEEVKGSNHIEQD